MDRLFEDVGFEPGFHFRSIFPRVFASRQRERELMPVEWSPRVDVLEREGQYVIRADLPGMTKDEVAVEVEEGMLILHGERKHENKEEREGGFYRECSYGSFYRAIPLPEGVEFAKATAEFKNGVLEVTIPAPVRPEQKPRRLEIREGK
jgi:HSP20 family protein